MATRSGEPVRTAGRDRRMLIRNGHVVTLDRTIGDLPGADVRVEGTAIAAVGPGLDGTGCDVIDASDMLVLPGFVDSHRHCWQAVLRAMSTDLTFPEYLTEIRAALGPHFRPEDVYAGTLLSVHEGLDAGITTVLDWAHIMNSPDHADASVAALKESGSRAVFAHGTPQDERMWDWHVDSQLPHPDDIRRVREEHFPTAEQLVTPAVALRGPDFSTIDVTARDWALARELELPITVHIGVVRPDLEPVRLMNERGILGADTTYVHCNYLTDHELELIAATGGTASISPEMEMHMCPGFPPTGRFLAAGLRPSLSSDTPVHTSGEMFTVMRMALAVERAIVHNHALRAGETVERLELTTRDVLEFVTIEGARACGLLDRIGTITPGKEADLILVRTDGLNLTPLNNPVGALVMFAKPADVDTVLVAGRPVKRGGRLLADTARLRRLAVESRDYLFSRSGRRLQTEGIA